MAQYQAYSADTKLTAAVKMYKEKMGKEPSLIVAPDWFETTTAPPNVQLVLSPNCSLVMLTDESETEFDTVSEFEIIQRVERAGELSSSATQTVTRRSRPITATCPHCKNTIRDWSVLGHYWENDFPPYWEKLAAYIFKRDKYTCAMCSEVFDVSKLDAHHIQPRDRGGADSSDNLITLCEDCHDWLHHYYESIERRTDTQIQIFAPIMRPY